MKSESQSDGLMNMRERFVPNHIISEEISSHGSNFVVFHHTANKFDSDVNFQVHLNALVKP